MITSWARTALSETQPEGGPCVDAARAEDRTRVARMLATPSAEWSDSDIDLVAFRAMTTLGGPETFKWILPHFLERSAANPLHGWMMVSEVLAAKLDDAGFETWPVAQQEAAVELLTEWLATRAPEEDDSDLKTLLGHRP